MTIGLTPLTLWLPAIFWLSYGLWNALWLAPPHVGALSALNVQYLLMLPAVLVVASRGLRPVFAGQWPYLAFLVWVAVGLAWSDPALDAQPAKSLIVYGLLGLTAAQVLAGAPRAMVLFCGSVALTAAIYAVWTVWFALETRFAYRAGVPVNPNFVATLVAPGLIVAVGLLFSNETRARWRWPLVLLGLLSAYACLLLGSRGVLLALVVAIAVLLLRIGPGWGRSWRLLAATAAVIGLAQLPAIPDAIWMAVRTPPAAAVGDASEARVAAPRRLRANSTAIGRFGESEITSFNLRGPLWLGALEYLTSGARPLVIGGGLGMNQRIAHDTNPIFANMHNIVLQVLVDFGLVGLTLFVVFHWQIGWALVRRHAWDSHVLLAGMTFFAVAGLTASVIDLHLYWVFLGIAAGTCPREP